MKLGDVLGARASATPLPSDVRAAFDAQVGLSPTARPFERALLVGAASPSVGIAFALGYQIALHRLVPSLSPGELGSLCVTEAGGGHPRALACAFDGARLTGEKRWATLSPLADALFVLSVRGVVADKKDFALVRVERGAPGSSIAVGAPTPFAPEVPHATLSFDRTPGAALPGDGFDHYVRAFRTIEDTMVMTAVGAHAVAKARSLGAPAELWLPALSALSALSVAAPLEPRDPTGHLLIAGASPQLVGALEAMAAGPMPELARDLPLLAVAGRARELRTKAALARSEAP